MKKYLLIIATFSTLSIKAQTSVYHPFPENNAIWNIHFSWYCFMNGTGNEYYSITFGGDTLINSQTYHKLTTPFIQSFSTGICGGISNGYKGSIRQDTTNKKIFYVPPTDTTEQLLYDFTMQVGDTVRGYSETNAFPPDIVQSIDSVLVGSNYRKRWNINTCYNIHFIEGIGSTYGLVERSPGCITDMQDYTVTCFQQNSMTLYPDTTINCQLITSVNSIEKKSNQVKIYPNPANDAINIVFYDDEAINAIVEIRDVLGKLIERMPLKVGTPFNYNVQSLGKAVYFISLYVDEKFIENKKLVLIK